MNERISSALAVQVDERGLPLCSLAFAANHKGNRGATRLIAVRRTVKASHLSMQRNALAAGAPLELLCQLFGSVLSAAI